MATRRPIVLRDGRLAELPTGDYVYAGGCVPFRIRAGNSFQVPADMQALYSQTITLDEDAMLILDGMLVETH